LSGAQLSVGSTVGRLNCRQLNCRGSIVAGSTVGVPLTFYVHCFSFNNLSKGNSLYKMDNTLIRVDQWFAQYIKRWRKRFHSVRLVGQWIKLILTFTVPFINCWLNFFTFRLDRNLVLLRYTFDFFSWRRWD